MAKKKLRGYLIYIAVIILSIIFLYPLFILFMLAFVPAQYTIYSAYPSLYPKGLTLQYFEEALKINLVGPLIKSLEVAFMVGAMALAIGIPAAYGLSKLKPNLAAGISTLFFLTNMMPSITIAIPMAVEFLKFGLYDTSISLALAQELVVLPLSIFILLGAFQALPKDLEAQARVDGAGLFRTIYMILTPLAKAGVVATFLIAWMMSWDEFTFAIFLSPIHPTLPIIIYENITRGNILATSAFAIVVTIPVIILAVVLAKYLRGEYLAGGLNG